MVLLHHSYHRDGRHKTFLRLTSTSQLKDMTSMRNYWLLLNVIYVSVTSQNELGNPFLSNFIQLVNDPTRYDKNFFPPTKNGEPIRINVSMIVYDLREVTEKTMSFRVDLYLTQIWNDPRFFLNQGYANLSYSVIQPEKINLMWHPDTFFPNALDSISVQPEDESFTHKTILKVNGRGDVFYKQRLTITANCKMNLQRYPFDFQLCKLAMRSFGLTRNVLVYKWAEDEPLVFVKELFLPDLHLFNSSTSEFTRTFTNEIFLGLNACFMFERKTNFYFMELYIPASLVVIVAWLSSLTEYRFTNLLSVLLAQLFLYFSYITVMPKVSDIKALDVFLVVCFFFIFVALVKTFFIKDHKSEEEANGKGKEDKVQISNEPTIKFLPSILQRFQSQCLEKIYSMWPSHHYCRGTNCILFTTYPTLFAMFSLIYYIVFMYILHDQSQMDRCDT